MYVVIAIAVTHNVLRLYQYQYHYLAYCDMAMCRYIIPSLVSEYVCMAVVITLIVQLRKLLTMENFDDSPCRI